MMKRAMINTVKYTKCLNSVSFIPIRSFATEKPVNKVHHTGSSSQWLRRHTTDPFVKQSKKDGYRSRAAYKLLEIDQKYNIIKPNSTIIDVGCAPGSWCQALLTKAKKTTPPSIIGIDLLKIEPLEGVCFLQGDFTSSLIQTKLKQLLSNRPVDLITSDIAPSFSGNHNIDHLRQIELSRTVYQFSLDYLNSNGILLMKLFQGSELNSFLNELKSSFKTITLIKPKASRSESSELYCLCRSLKTK